MASFNTFPPLQRILSPELDATLTTLDAWRPDSSSDIEAGAFCVFAVQPPALNHGSNRDRSPSVYEGKLVLLSHVIAGLKA